MRQPAATLETGDGRAHARDAAQSQPTHQPRGAAMRFAHASGSRPLDGYTIKRGIGVGGFGEVYFATSDAGKEVALKRIQRSMDIELRGVSQCLNLKHPNLIALFDIKYDDHGAGWVVMEYVAGESLKDVTERNPNGMPLDEVKAWFEGIARGVSYLHDHGIVHRDLKPGNIFLDEDAVKIGDYGLSKFISCSRRSGQTESVGTVHYMAPEIGKGVYGKEIDVYALGIMLYEMITGRVPFEGESSQEIIMKHLTAEPDLTGIGQPYRSVIQKALAKDPELRFSDVGELLSALHLGGGARVKLPQIAGVKRDVEPLVPKTPVAETLYIGDDQDMSFGPLKEVVTAEAVVERPRIATSEEPIARAVGTGWNRLRDWWSHSQLSSPVKVVLLVVAAVLVVLNAQWLIPVGVVFGALYLVYFGIRSIVLATSGNGATQAQSTPPAMMAGSASRHHHRAKHEIVRDSLLRKSHGERLAELTGSLLMAAVVSAVLSLVMMVVGGHFVVDSIYTWSFYSWLAVSSTLGAWTVLSIGKFWESSKGDDVRRRFVMLAAGLALGAVVFGATDLLMVHDSGHLTVAAIKGPFADASLPVSMRAADGTLALPAYLAYFAGLFAILRWWKQADPLRTTRLSIWSVGVCVLWALIFPFAQPWGFTLAATMSIAIQLSSPWISPKERNVARYQFHDV
jgi:hypothetical protein